MEFMLRHVRLQSEHLPRFIELLERNPGLGALVHHIHFWDQEQFVSPSIVDMDRATFEPGYQQHYPNGKRIQLDPIDEDILASKRAFILDSLPNLRSIHASGQELVFPFCKRVDKDAVMLKGLLSPFLKSINIGGPDIKNPSISSTKVLWLLLNLKQLDEGKFFASLDQEDVKYFKNHYEILCLLQFGIKNFEISLLPSIEGTMRDSLSKRGNLNYPQFIHNLLKRTKNLNSFSLRVETGQHEHFLTDEAVAGGLQDSVASLKKLTLKGLLYAAVDSYNPYQKFLNLEELIGDDITFLFQKRVQKRSKDSASSAIPPKIKHVSLAFNVATPKGGKHVFMAMEDTFSGFVRDVPQGIPLETVSTFRDPIDEYGIHHETFLENYKWSEGRERLIEACEKRNVKLVLLKK